VAIAAILPDHRGVERELTAAIEIADPRGRLRRDAVGWSRHPLHRCNVDGAARAHAFDYWCVLTEELALTVLLADVGLAGVALVSVLELDGGALVERVHVRPGGLAAAMPASPDGVVTVDAWRLHLVVGPDRLRAEARTLGGRRIDADVAIERPPGHETVNLLVPWDDERFHFTSKQQALPARGLVRVDRRERRVDGFACRDFGRGRRPAGIDWCWAFGAARRDGGAIGLNLGARWTDGTGVTENAVVIDGRVHKIADDVDFALELGAGAPWRIATRASGRVALTFTPIAGRAVRVPPLVRLHQRVGRFTGTVVDDAGAPIALDRVLGVAEWVRGRW
jgi:hypothetical protein